MPIEYDVKKYSVTRDDETQVPVFHWMLNPSWVKSGGLPAYWSPARDWYLRQLLYQPYHDFWTGAVGIAIAKMSSLDWKVEGETPRLRQQAQDLLMPFLTDELSKHLQDFLHTDNGAFIEIVRASKGGGSRILGLVHLDSLRVTRTGDSEIVAYYRDDKGAEHELRQHQIVMLADMPSPSATHYGIGLCAASRGHGAIKKLEAIERYIYEKVSGERPLAVDMVGGVSEPQLRTAIESAKEDNRGRGNIQYMGAVVVPTLSDIAITHTRINFAELPDGFEYEKQFNNCALLTANAIGLDVQDLQPLTGRPLGSGEQSQILEDKAKGKNLAAWRKQFTHQSNEWMVADTIIFAFSGKDLRDQKQQADVFKLDADAVGSLVEKAILNSGQAKQILADLEMIPKEFVPEDVTSSESLTDEEKESAEPEPVAITQARSIREVTSEYRDGLNRFIADTLVGRMDATDMARAHRALIRETAPRVYVEGLRAMGIDEDEIDVGDREVIAGWIAEQVTHVRDFANATVDARKDKAAQSSIAERVTLWVEALNTLGNLARASAQSNASGTWTLGRTKEHCDTCNGLNGARHRVKWFISRGYVPREPGSETLQCNGYNCECRIVSDDGRRLL